MKVWHYRDGFCLILNRSSSTEDVKINVEHITFVWSLKPKRIYPFLRRMELCLE